MCMASCTSVPSSDSKSEHTHEFGEWFITKNATCAEDGVKVRYCSCGEKQSDSISKLSHTVVIDEAVEPTCTRTGLTEGKHCSECNETIVEQTIVNPLGHTEVVDAAVAPTCTKTGFTEGKHCSVCNTTIIAQTVVDALGHTETVDAAVNATCTTTGLTEGKHCSVCNETIIAQIETPKNNHFYDDKYDAECNKCGFIRDAECPHTNVSTLDAKNATCTEPGLTGGKVCVDCEEVIIVQTVIDAKGHAEVVDEAVPPTYENTGLSEGKHCSVCGTVIIAQQIIPMLKTYSITYENIKTAKYPTITEYIEQIGLDSLPEISVDGYDFIGWYTEPNGSGEFINKIPQDSTGNITLYAHWELLTYTVTPLNVYNYGVTQAEITYTIEKRLVLNNPEWSGMIFKHWTDQYNNIYTPDTNLTIFPEKMTGDLILTANWKLPQNIATPAASGAKLYSAYSGEDGFLYFFYDLGTIENVVLEYSDLYTKTSNVGYVLQSSKTVTIGEEKAESIANTVSESISSTTSWEETNSWSKSHSEHFNATIGVTLETKLPFIKTTVESSFEGGFEDTTTEEYIESTSGSNTDETTESNTVTSSMAYKQEITTEITRTYSIGENLPNGYYACVNAANLRVIAVVSYDISTGKLYLNTYSRLDNMHSMVMYYKDVNQLNKMLGEDPLVENLDFSIKEHEQEILDKITNSYYVKYDANGGTGTMPTTIHTVGVTEKIAENTFTKPEYKFIGWKIESSGKKLEDGEEITDLGEALKTVILKAIWESNAFVRDDNYIYYGEYPQTIKVEDVTITSITDERGYWLGSDGCYYAAITATPYGKDYTFTSGDSITNGETYYFKVEPIRWRILSTNGETALILCDSIIENMAYQPNCTYGSSTDTGYTTANGAPSGTYANNYEYSAVRKWLNETFYKIAFNELQKRIIIEVEVDNSAKSTNPCGKEKWWNDGVNDYACENTYDKIFLLSEEEVTNRNYEFCSYNVSDKKRQMQTSDYSRATGAYTYFTTNEDNMQYNGNGYWWLRSPNHYYGHSALSVYFYGEPLDFINVSSNSYGVVPAMWINLNP